eukprot:s638_g30.t2
MSAVVEAAAAQAAQRVSEQFEEDFVKYNRLCVLNERQNRALHQTHFEMHCEMTGLREQVAELTDLVNEQKREVIQLVNMMKKQKTPENRSGPNAARSPAIVPVTKTKAASAKAMAMSGAARVMKKDKVNGKNPGEIYAGTPVCSQDQGEEGNAEVRKGHQDRCIQRGCAQQRGQPWLFPVQITTPILCAVDEPRCSRFDPFSSRWRVHQIFWIGSQLKPNSQWHSLAFGHLAMGTSLFGTANPHASVLRVCFPRLKKFKHPFVSYA